MAKRSALVLGFAAMLAALLLAGSSQRSVPEADAAFHFAVIDEVMTSYGGDANVQFIEIRMTAAGQNFVSGTSVGIWDAAGVFQGTHFTVSGNVASGTAGGRWIMGTSAFATASGLTPDKTMPAGLPTGGGMVCWGLPFTVSNPGQYVDCLSYGTYSGAGNVHTGTMAGDFPAPDDADGHSLRRISTSQKNAVDFACGDPATPEKNDGTMASMTATESCPTSADSDSDGLPDVDEINIYNTDPFDSDSDGDGLLDGAEVLTHLTDPLDMDTDEDAYNDFREVFMITDALDNCPATTTANDEVVDAWPPDFDDTRIVNILDIVQLTPPAFNTAPPNPNYMVRKDLTASNSINILDIVLMTPPVFNTSCTP
jgi:hypothetical protein